MHLAAASTNMVFDVACELEYNVRVPSTLILGVHAQQSAAQTILTEQFSIEPPVDMPMRGRTRDSSTYTPCSRSAPVHAAV